MGYTFAVSPSDVLTDRRGDPVAGQRIGVWTAQIGGQAATGLFALDGGDLPDGATITDRQGRYGFTTPNEALGPVLWLDHDERRWPVVAIESAVEATGYVGEVSDAYRRATSAAERAGDSAAAAAKAHDANDLADEADATAATLGEQLVTLDDLYVTTYVPAWVSAGGSISATLPGSNSAGLWQTVFIAPFPVRVRKVSLSFEYWGTSVSNTAYWEFGVSHMHWTGDSRTWRSFGTSTTQASGDNAGGAVTPRKGRPLNVDAERLIATGDLVLVGFFPHGNPADMHYAATITLSYTPA